MNILINYENFINNFKRKYEKGFTGDEIMRLIDIFPNIDKTKFFESMGHNSCTNIDNVIIYYDHDVLTALKCGLEKRDENLFEFD